MIYLLLKTAHILSVVLFLGNIVTGIFWVAHANRSADARLVAHAMSGVIRSDTYFTMPSVVAILVTGFALAGIAQMPILGTPWIGASLILFGLSGLLFAVFLAPLQRRIVAEASEMQTSASFPSPAYRRMLRRWEIIGIVAILLPLGALALMVFKPANII